MAYKVSDNTIEVLKELYKDHEFEPLTNKKQVQEMLFGLAFIAMGGSFKNNDDEKANEVLKKVNNAGEELKLHMDELDLKYINSKLMK